ncbi:MAG: prolyl oligopeptidase family serine peptidase [Aliidongia sp.]
MSTPHIAPYGTWQSPVTPAAIGRQALALGAMYADGDALYWLEGRPNEGGRWALMRWRRDGGTQEVTPAPVNVASRVYEYGGGAYRVSEGWIVYSDACDNSVRLISPSGVLRTIAAVPGCRYADFWFDLRRERVLAVREDYRKRAPTEPQHSIVALSLDPADPADAGEVLVGGSDFVAAPRVSPNGGRLAWLEWDHPELPWTGTLLRQAELDRRGLPQAARHIAGSRQESIVQPLFSPEGILHFCSDRSGWWNLYRWQDGAVQPVASVTAEIGGPDRMLATRHYNFLDDGRILCRLVDEGIMQAALIAQDRCTNLPIGQVRGCPVPLDQGFAYISAPPDRPLEILYQDRLETSDPVVIAVSGSPLIDRADISVGQPIRFSTSGGMAHAFFYEPRNTRFAAPADDLPPLLVMAHGGPTTQTINALALSIQYWTTRGFAVADVNYGGSSGFGRAYRRRLDGQWGIVDVADCIAAARFLRDAGLVDPARIAIRGNCAGGFTTLAALAATDLFKAGVCHSPITDPIQFRHETHKLESHDQDHLIGPLPDAHNLYRERSPLANAHRIIAPRLLFQGLDDKIVLPHQTEIMAETLADRGVPVAYYAFAGEGHGFRKAETIRRMLDLELSFYGLVFGFVPPGLEERVTLPHLP